ncbi:MAG: class I SAM-dependent methyltransferase [Dehalococcoidia bacterium]|nr:class I SAM-dependent methyltransferase [Dehalococcoidia bacterium]
MRQKSSQDIDKPGTRPGERVPLGEDYFCSREQVDRYHTLSRSPLRYLVTNVVRCVQKKKVGPGCVLDIGSGTGRFLLSLGKKLSHQNKLIGIDISREMVKKALEEVKKSNSINLPEFHAASADCLPFRDAAFDLIISSYSLHQWAHPERVFNEVHRVLNKGGAFLIRDGKRPPPTLFWRFLLGIASKMTGLNNWQRLNWYKAVEACYTVDEIKDILEHSQFTSWKVYSDLVFFELCIEGTKT